MLRGHDNDHDVGYARHGQWNKGAVYDRDQKYADEPEAEEDMEEGVVGSTMSCRSLVSSISEVLRRGEGRRE